MSKSIEVSDQDYARIQQAADADGMPVDAWVVGKLSLNGNAADKPLLGPDGKPAKTMYDVLKDRIGVINSGTGKPSSSDVSESFGEYLEDKQRRGIL